MLDKITVNDVSKADGNSSCEEDDIESSTWKDVSDSDLYQAEDKKMGDSKEDKYTSDVMMVGESVYDSVNMYDNIDVEEERKYASVGDTVMSANQLEESEKDVPSSSSQVNDSVSKRDEISVTNANTTNDNIGVRVSSIMTQGNTTTATSQEINIDELISQNRLTDEYVTYKEKWRVYDGNIYMSIS
jgi:hypothetical protein